MTKDRTRSRRVDALIEDFLKRQARNGRALQMLKDPQTGHPVLDSLKDLGDGVLPSDPKLEAVADAAAHWGLQEAIGIQDSAAIAGIEKAIGRPLIPEEIEALKRAGLSAFENATRDDRSDAESIEAGRSQLEGLSFPAKQPGEGKAPDDGLREKASLFDQLRSGVRDVFETRDPPAPSDPVPPSPETSSQDADDGARDAPRGAPDTPAEGRGEERGSAAQSDAGGLDRESAAFARTAEATLGAVDETEEILLTPLDRWPEADMRRLLNDPGYWGADRALRDGYRDRVALWHGLTYGTDPVRRDATGRMVEPAPKRPPPAARPALAGADGEPFGHAVRALSQFLGAPSRRAGPTQAVQSLQRGLNRLSSAEARPARARDPYKASDAPDALAPGGAVGADRPLKEDGVLGPKTAAATRRAIARRGRPAVEAAARAAAGSSPPLSASASAQGRAPRDRFGRPKLLA